MPLRITARLADNFRNVVRDQAEEFLWAQRQAEHGISFRNETGMSIIVRLHNDRNVTGFIPTEVRLRAQNVLAPNKIHREQTELRLHVQHRDHLFPARALLHSLDSGIKNQKENGRTQKAILQGARCAPKTLKRANQLLSIQRPIHIAYALRVAIVPIADRFAEDM